MSDPTPEVPETPEDSWRQWAHDASKFLGEQEWRLYQRGDVDGLKERFDLLAAEDEHPDAPPITSDKLLQIADYIDETDGLIIKMLREAKVPEERMEGAGLAGSQMQDDLREWAEAIRRWAGYTGGRVVEG